MGRKYRYRYTTEITLGHQNWQPPFPVTKNVHPRQFKCPLPMSDAEFAVLSRIVFGVPLSLKRLCLFEGRTGQAEIAEPYDTFHGEGFDFGRHESAGYERLGWFHETVFGPINCSRSLTYTDFKCLSHRHWRRLETWELSRCLRQSNYLRPAFVRLARSVGAGENNDGPVWPPDEVVLIGGREDGAHSAFAKATGGAHEPA